MAKNYVGKKYSDLNDRQRARMSRSEFRNLRSDQKAAQRATKKADISEALTRPAQSRFAADKVFDLVNGGDFGTDVNRTQNVGARIARLEEKAASGKDVSERLAKKNARLDRIQNRVALQDAYTPGDIDSYDFSSIGRRENRVGLKDLKFLADQGYSAKEISEAIENKDASVGGRAQKLLSKYVDDINDFKPVENVKDPIEDIETPIDTDVPVGLPDPITEPITNPIDVDVNPIVPIGGGGGGASPNIATGVIGGNTGDISLSDSNNYGTINTGIINDIRDYGGGYGANENNTGLTQRYIDLMQENWEDYSGPGYGMFVTDTRVDKANQNNPIDTNQLYGGMNRFAQNFYDRGNILSGNLYGDSSKFKQPTYGAYPTFSE